MVLIPFIKTQTSETEPLTEIISEQAKSDARLAKDRAKPKAQRFKEKAEREWEEAEEEGEHIWEVAKEKILQPGVAGGLMGLGEHRTYLIHNLYL